MRRRDLSIIHWIKFLFIMPWGLLLRHDGPFCYFRIVFVGRLCGYFGDSVLTLRSRDVFGKRFIIELHELWRINLSIVHWLDFLRGMSRRIVLCDDWSNRSHGFLLIGNLCNIRISCMFVLREWLVFWAYCLDLHQLWLRYLPTVYRLKHMFCMSYRFVLFHIGAFQFYW